VTRAGTSATEEMDVKTVDHTHACTERTPSNARDDDDKGNSEAADDTDEDTDALERELMAAMTQSTDADGDEDEFSHLTTLPDDVVNVILRHLAPCDLTALASTCATLRAKCDADVLWRQCFEERFGNDFKTSVGGMMSWKRKYFAADRAEITRELRMAPEGFERICVEAQVSKRSQVCVRLAPLQEIGESDRAVANWKRKRSFSCDDVDRHRCSRRLGCTYHVVHVNVFVCESSGRVHVCDENCRERMFDTENETEICEISGASFDTVLQEHDDENTADLQDQQEQYFERGFFGRAFAVGYECENEVELQTALWGAPIRNR